MTSVANREERLARAGNPNPGCFRSDVCVSLCNEPLPSARWKNAGDDVGVLPGLQVRTEKRTLLSLCFTTDGSRQPDLSPPWSLRVSLRTGSVVQRTKETQCM